MLQEKWIHQTSKGYYLWEFGQWISLIVRACTAALRLVLILLRIIMIIIIIIARACAAPPSPGLHPPQLHPELRPRADGLAGSASGGPASHFLAEAAPRRRLHNIQVPEVFPEKIQILNNILSSQLIYCHWFLLNSILYRIWSKVRD